MAQHDMYTKPPMAPGVYILTLHTFNGKNLVALGNGGDASINF